MPPVHSAIEVFSFVNYFNTWVVQLLGERFGMAPAVALLLVKFIQLLFVLILCRISWELAHKYFMNWLTYIARKTTSRLDDYAVELGIVKHLVSVAPGIIFYISGSLFPNFTSWFERLGMAWIIFCLLRAANAFLTALLKEKIQSTRYKDLPIKAYAQGFQIILILIGGLFLLSILMNTSLLTLISGVGAMTAVLLFIFKDSLQGFVASIVIASGELVKKGDWVEMPKYGADGDVVDVTLHTIRVQNWDKTITTIPVYAIISDSFKNWRGMKLAGGRRIKRALLLDMESIDFCSDELLERLKKVQLIKDYIAERSKEIEEWNRNTEADPSSTLNGRRMTNVGIFRRYVEAYLRKHPKIHQGMTFLIRQLPPNEHGLPLEIYVFTNDIIWANYEGIQADIFDHLISAIPQFDLRLFQSPSGYDIAQGVKMLKSGSNG